MFILTRPTFADRTMKLARRGESRQSQSFWVSVAAATGILTAVILLAWLTYCWVKSRARRRQRRPSKSFDSTGRLRTTSTSTASEKITTTEHLNSTAGRDYMNTEEAPSAAAMVVIESPEAATTGTRGKEEEEEPASNSILPRRKKKMKKKKADNSNNGSCTSDVFASIGRKSVASVQWVSFRGSMDLRPHQSEQRLQVVNLDESV